MNKIKGIIQEIKADEGILWVGVQAEKISLSAIVIEATSSALPVQTGDEVVVAFKETAMSIATHWSGELSIRNRFDVVITSLTKSSILTKLTLDFYGSRLISVITSASAERMKLSPGDQVKGLVKTTDIILMKTE